MDKRLFSKIESYMQKCGKDSSHSPQHIYRVLYTALEIAKQECEVDYDVLIAACLLHDIGRAEQFKDHKVCHALAGEKMAREFLDGIWDEQKTEHVCQCIRTHRFRSSQAPKSIEAKILYDADTLDVTGAIGIARTLMYQGKTGEPLYRTDAAGDAVIDEKPKKSGSFVDEYNYKLKNVHKNLNTDYAKTLAEKRSSAAKEYYKNIMDEIAVSASGKKELSKIIKKAKESTK